MKAWFVIPSNSWFIRSGAFSLGFGAGMFSFLHVPGFANQNESFLVVCYYDKKDNKINDIFIFIKT